MSMKKTASELRQDAVSGDWVVMATGRAKRPHDFLREKRPAFNQPKRSCPFETLRHNAFVVRAADGTRRPDRWWTQVIPNKYPALGEDRPAHARPPGSGPDLCAVLHRVGPYQWTEGAGFHDVVVTRDHTRSFALMSPAEVDAVFGAYQERIRALAKKECVEYVSVFHNHGMAAGATISHPHSQIAALPVIPPDVGRSIKGSAGYFKKRRSCVHCAIVQYELKEGARVIYENGACAVVAPYASKTAFEMRVFPKRHSAYFEGMGSDERAGAAAAFQAVLAKLHRGLHNPDYNFFLHTAPVRGGNQFEHYHWHIEILPKTAIWAGFEIGTGIEISTIAPETAAAFLRKIKA